MPENAARGRAEAIDHPAGTPEASGTPLVWTVFQEGTGRVENTGERLRLLLPPSPGAIYCNAQIGDLPPARWRPPLRFSVRARFNQRGEQLRGTAGFGFWNYALSPGLRGIHPPQAVWYFFGAPPYNVPLCPGVPGHGFKAMAIDACRLPFYLLLPFLPVGVLLMRVPLLYRLLWPIAQRAMKESEAALGQLDLAGWHQYEFDWGIDRVTFTVDGKVVHVAPYAPDGPLCFVAWIDNAYAIATPQGQFAMGKVETTTMEWLELETLCIKVHAR